MLVAVRDLVGHPSFVIWGTAVYTSVVDVCTQWMELKVLKIEEERPDEQLQVVDNRSCITVAWCKWDSVRTGRMAVVGVVTGVLNLGFLTTINTSIPKELSWPHAALKTLLGLVLTPLFFALNTAVVEFIRNWGFGTVLRKLQQDFRNTLLVTCLHSPVALVCYRLFATPGAQMLFFAAPNFFVSVALNHLYNKRVAQPLGLPECPVDDAVPECPVGDGAPVGAGGLCPADGGTACDAIAAAPETRDGLRFRGVRGYGGDAETPRDSESNWTAGYSAAGSAASAKLRD